MHAQYDGSNKFQEHHSEKKKNRFQEQITIRKGESKVQTNNKDQVVELLNQKEIINIHVHMNCTFI